MVSYIRMEDSMVHVEDRVRCTGCNKVFCKYCEERCPSCYGIHIAISKPSLKYSQENSAKEAQLKRIRIVG